jgi:putative nucleotidyltransferase with HDIG domain
MQAMPGADARPTRTARLYVAAVIAAGAVVTILSYLGLLRQPPRIDYYNLMALTIISAIIPLKLPNVSANISVSETFVFAGTLLYGPAGGTILVFLDALFIWARLARTAVNVHRMLFSLAAPPLSLWIASTLLFQVVGNQPLAFAAAADRPGLWTLAGGLIAFASLYFLMNTWLIAVAIALEQRLNAAGFWYANFSKLSLNYLAGASIALLLVYNTSSVTWAFLLVILPLILVLFLMYRRSMDRIQQAEQHVQEMSRTFLQTIEALALAIDAKDQVTHGHIRRVQRHAMALAHALGIDDPKALDALRAAALLHDTGKLAVPDYILNKPGKLTPAEFARMQLHATVGADILKSIDFPYDVEPIVRHHHENWDGSGYPAGLKGAAIPLGARILSVVDCYDALTSDRPYRSRMTRPQAEQILRERRGQMYDPWVVDGFLGILDTLEQPGAAEPRPAPAPSPAEAATPAGQVNVIAAAGIEDREVGNLRRHLPSASSPPAMAEMLFDRLRFVVPAQMLVIYAPVWASNELSAIGCAGTGASEVLGRRVSIAERVSGWVFASGQAALNSEAALEFGPVAGSFPVPLRHALVVPVKHLGRIVAVLGLYGSETFTEDHQRVLEVAADALGSALTAMPLSEV